VEVAENRLEIRGDKKQSYAKEDGSYFMYGSFARAITLPCEINPNKSEAKFKNGLLKITLPKSEQAKSKRIEVRG
jgi:HSP20 family protein